MAKDLVRQLGTIVAPFSNGSTGGICTPFEIRTVGAIKTIMLRITGKVDVTTALTAVNVMGALRLLSSIQIKVNQQPGPIAADSFTLAIKNFKDRCVMPFYADLDGPGTGIGKTFEACIFLDFSTPGFPGGDLTIFKPKLGNIYTLECAFNPIGVLGKAAAETDMVWSVAPTIDVFSHEILGLEKTPNKYNASFLVQDSLLKSTEQRLAIPYGNLLKEMHLHVSDASGTLADGVVDHILFRNGVSETFRNLSAIGSKRFQDYIGPLVNPNRTPDGIYFIDMAINNDFSSVLPTAGMKELELALEVANPGSIKVLVNEIRDGID